MTRRFLLPAVAYIAAVCAVAVAAAWIAALPIHSTPVSIAAGVTAGWLAGIALPCPCHHRAGRR